jgi:hypothetical protein
MKNANETRIRLRCTMPVLAVLLVATLFSGGAATAQTEPMKVTAPQPTVPEIFTLMGQYVRIAYNNEGFATLGYRMAQDEIGNEWMMLTVGVTLRKPTENYKLTRDDVWLSTPDGTKIPMASQQEYQAAAGKVNALNRRARVMHDSIDYFPLDASQGCALQFFSDLGKPMQAMSWDATELSWQRACLGRIFFKVPGGITVGQHWLHFKFANSELQVPFRTLTEEEAKQFQKSWKEIKEQHEAALKGQ